MITGSEVVSIEWGVLVPDAVNHVGSGRHPAVTKLVFASLDGTAPIHDIAAAGGITLDSLPSARHLLVQGLSADLSIGFGMPAVAGESILIPAKQIYRIENIGKLRKYLYLLSTGPIIVQPFA